MSGRIGHKMRGVLVRMCAGDALRQHISNHRWYLGNDWIGYDIPHKLLGRGLIVREDALVERHDKYQFNYYILTEKGQHECPHMAVSTGVVEG